MAMKTVSEIFGSMVFGDDAMKKYLPKEAYKRLQETIKNGTKLDTSVADEVASAMKNWAIEHGATHFTHWFQPMTGITAEKHDSFISPSKDGKIIMEFSGKELIQGEPDASSFPSGGIRSTLKPGLYGMGPHFLCVYQGGVLCIPSVFCSYSGEVLDKRRLCCARWKRLTSKP